MKNKFLKYYVVAIYLCSTIITFAQPGTDDNGGGLETNDPAAPIDDYVWLLSLIGLIYVFLRIRAFALQGNSQPE